MQENLVTKEEPEWETGDRIGPIKYIFHPIIVAMPTEVKSFHD